VTRNQLPYARAPDHIVRLETRQDIKNYTTRADKMPELKLTRRLTPFKSK
jgi:hypothetical protein